LAGNIFLLTSCRAYLHVPATLTLPKNTMTNGDVHGDLLNRARKIPVITGLRPVLQCSAVPAGIGIIEKFFSRFFLPPISNALMRVRAISLT
jgi:hypothetical protein